MIRRAALRSFAPPARSFVARSLSGSLILAQSALVGRGLSCSSSAAAPGASNSAPAQKKKPVYNAEIKASPGPMEIGFYSFAGFVVLYVLSKLFGENSIFSKILGGFSWIINSFLIVAGFFFGF